MPASRSEIAYLADPPSQQGMEETEVNARWQAEMAEFFELPDGARPDTSFTRVAEIFHLD